MRRLILLTLLALSYGTAACSDGSLLEGIPGTKSKKKKKKDSESGITTDDEDGGVDGNDPSKRRITSNGSGYLLKSSDQIESSIRVCVGGGRTTIRDVLLIGAQESGDKLAFLNPIDYPVGDNVIEAARLLFDSEQSQERGGTRGGTMSLGYLTALQNTANVTAYNCSVANLDQGGDAELCDCSNQETASAMLDRCLSIFDPTTLTEATAAFAASCAADQKGAIASMIASFAFAEAP